MFTAKAQKTLVRTTKETVIHGLKLFLIFIIAFFVALLVMFEGIGEAPNAFFPKNFCVAFADPALCPIAPGPTCSPCNGKACGCPCPNGVCGEAIVGPCPVHWTSSAPPPTPFGEVTGGPIFCPTQACSPAGCDKQCPTGMDPNDPYGPPLAKMNGEEFCQNICPANLCGKGTLSGTQENLLVFLSIIEIMYFAGGITFALVVGPKVLTMNASKLKNACIFIYFTLCYHLITWLPHTMMHQWFPDTDAVLALEFAFHVPIAASAIILVVFVYRMLKMSSSYRAPVPSGSNALARFAQGPYALPVLVTILFTIPALVVDYAVENPAQETWSQAQHAAFRIVNIFQAVEFGISCGFLVLMFPVVRGVEELRVFKQAIPLIFALWYLMGNWFWHSFAHSQITFPFDPVAFLTMEFTFHWISQICSVIVAWNMMKLVDMGLAYDTSPFRKTQTGSKVSQASRIGTAQTQASSIVGKPAWQAEGSVIAHESSNTAVSPLNSPVVAYSGLDSSKKVAPAPETTEAAVIRPLPVVQATSPEIEVVGEKETMDTAATNDTVVPIAAEAQPVA